MMLRATAAAVVIAAVVASAATAGYPTVTTAQWVAAKNAWTRAAHAHGVTGICTWPKYQTPGCDFGTTVGSVSLHGSGCQLEAWAVKPAGAPYPHVVKVPLNPCKRGWARTLPVPWQA